MGYVYFPILKTTDAELKAYEKLDDEVKNNILPIFELTRSRKSSKNIDRSIFRRLEKIRELCSIRPFILDLTTDTQLVNDQIKGILNSPKGGFPLWVDLISNLKKDGLNVIPIVHYNPNFPEDAAIEVDKLSKLSEFLAFRVDIDDPDSVEYIKEISKSISPEKILLILDAKFVDLRRYVDDASILFRPILESIIETFVNNSFKGIFCAFSSYPDSVTKYGNDRYGVFPRLEKKTFVKLFEQYSEKLALWPCDYASVHPIRYDTAGGQWIPRIDFFDDENAYYYRYRRENRGYVAAAERTINDPHYRVITSLSVWADNEILTAALGKPNGGNPSYWISCRVNLYISKNYVEFKEQNQMIL